VGNADKIRHYNGRKLFFLKYCLKTNELIMSDALEPEDIPEFQNLNPC
jgi:hypothetical protein